MLYLSHFSFFLIPPSLIPTYNCKCIAVVYLSHLSLLLIPPSLIPTYNCKCIAMLYLSHFSFFLIPPSLIPTYNCKCIAVVYLSHLSLLLIPPSLIPTYNCKCIAVVYLSHLSLLLTFSVSHRIFSYRHPPPPPLNPHDATACARPIPTAAKVQGLQGPVRGLAEVARYVRQEDQKTIPGVCQT